MKITKEFIKELKKADSVSVRINKDTAKLTLHKNEQKGKNGWIKPEVQTDHNGFKARIPSKFNKAWFWDMYKDLYGFETLQNVIKPGDEIIFTVEVNNNGYLNKAMIPIDAWEGDERLHHVTYHNLYHEVLTAQIIRKDKIFIRSLHIGDQISVDNNARMLN